jgi:iron complex transport system substrate-binding protein
MTARSSSKRGHGRLLVAPVVAALATAVLTATGLTACGGGESTAQDGAAKPGTGSSAAFPRTITHVMGTAKIPAKPERVVVLDTGEMDDVTMLGIKPVGAVSPHFKTAGGFPAYLSDKLQGVEDVGPLLEPNLELIASLRPDLILSSKVRHEKIYDKLQAIAPTVFTETTGGTWKENLAVHAKALGREKQAADALHRYEARAKALGAAIEKKYDGTMPTVSVVRFIAGPTRLYRSNSYSGVVLSDVGLKRPASQTSNDPANTMLDVSPEQVDKAEADLIFVTTADDPDKTQRGDVVAGPVWKDLDAVKNNKVFEVPDETWMSGIGVQAAERMLADVAKAAGVELPGT